MEKAGGECIIIHTATLIAPGWEYETAQAICNCREEEVKRFFREKGEGVREVPERGS